MLSPRRRVSHVYHRSLYRRHHRHRSVIRRSSSSEEINDKPSATNCCRLRDDEDVSSHIGHRDDDEGIDVDVDIDDEEEDIEIELEDDDEEEEDVEAVGDDIAAEDSDHDMHHDSVELDGVAAAGVAAVGFEVATFLRRVTLKPRRTLSLSPTPGQ